MSECADVENHNQRQTEGDDQQPAAAAASSSSAAQQPATPTQRRQRTKSSAPVKAKEKTKPKRVQAASSSTGNKRAFAAAKRIRSFIGFSRSLPEIPQLEQVCCNLLEQNLISGQHLKLAIQWAEANYADRYCKKITAADGIEAAIESWLRQAQRAEAAKDPEEERRAKVRAAIAEDRKREAEEAERRKATLAERDAWHREQQRKRYMTFPELEEWML